MRRPKARRTCWAVMKRYKGTIGAILARRFVATMPFGQASGWPKPLLRLADLLEEHLVPGPNSGEATK